MKVILLSIKPEYVSKILSGEKRYEFRKWLIQDFKNIRVVIYSSAPVQRIVGEFDVDDVLCEDPQILWNKTASVGGISKEKFLAYFAQKSVGYAYKIKNLKIYNQELKISDIGIYTPPQRYIYLTDKEYSRLDS
jgi:predicted transcriptional regulator